MSDQIKKLLASASHASSAAADMIEAVSDGGIRPIDNVGSGDTVTILADSLRLLIDAMGSGDEDISQLHGALIRFLEERP